MLKFEKMNLFDIPHHNPNPLLVHACNAQGVWGRGIALEFKQRFPEAHKGYVEFCKKLIRGQHCYVYDSIICPDLSLPSYADMYAGVVCLITSETYAPPECRENILLNTEIALEQIPHHLHRRKFYSNKFNSGLFGVPWEDTQECLREFVEKYNLDWTVCTL